MATHDLTNGNAGYSANENLKYVVLDSGNIAITAAQLATAEVCQLLKVPAGFLCHGVDLEVVTADTGTTTVAGVGYGGSTTGFLAAGKDLKAAAGTHYHTADDTLGMEVGGYLFGAADTIDLLAGTNTAPSGCTVRLKAYGVRLY